MHIKLFPNPPSCFSRHIWTPAKHRHLYWSLSSSQIYHHSSHNCSSHICFYQRCYSLMFLINLVMKIISGRGCFRLKLCRYYLFPNVVLMETVVVGMVHTPILWFAFKCFGNLGWNLVIYVVILVIGA